MNANHKAALDLFGNTDRDWKERVAEVLERYSMKLEELEAAVDEVLFSGNDLAAAATGVAAMLRTYPDHESDEFGDAVNRVLYQTCLLQKMHSESKSDFPMKLEFKVEEMLDIIFDGAERIEAGFPLAI